MQLTPGPKSVADYLGAMLSQAKANRDPVERKWLQNWGDFLASDEAKGSWDTRGEWKPGEDNDKGWKSKIRSDGTRQKIQAAHAQLTDIFFQGGRIPFMLTIDERSVPDVSPDFMREAEAAAEVIEEDIQTCANETDAQNELGMTLLYGGIYGEMILKGTITDVEDSFYGPSEDGQLAKQTLRRPTIACAAVDPWMIWRDLESPDIRKGAYVFESAPCNLHDLEKWKRLPFHDVHAIERVIAKHSGQTGMQAAADITHEPPWLREIPNRLRTIQTHEAWALVPSILVDGMQWGRAVGADGMTITVAPTPAVAATPEAAGIGQDAALAEPVIAPPEPPPANETQMTWIFAKFVDDELLAFQAEPGPHKYRNQYWEQDIDRKQGRGIADNNLCNQHVLDGLFRAYDNQLKILSSIMIVLNRCKFVNGSSLEKVLKEGGVLEVDADVDDLRKAFDLLKVPDVTGPIVKGIESFMAFQDLSTHVPRIEQGQQTFEAQTLGELHMRLEQGGKYLGGVARRLDNLVQWFAQENYDYRMSDPDSDLPKVPAVVKALGFTSFQNKTERAQKLINMIQMALTSPLLLGMTELGWLWEEYGKSIDLEADQYIKSQDRQQIEAQPGPDILTEAKALLMQAQAELAQAKAEREAIMGGVHLADAEARHSSAAPAHPPDPVRASARAPRQAQAPGQAQEGAQA